MSESKLETELAKARAPAQTAEPDYEARIHQEGTVARPAKSVRVSSAEATLAAVREAIGKAIVELDKAAYDSGQCKVVNAIYRAQKLLRAVGGQ